MTHCCDRSWQRVVRWVVRLAPMIGLAAQASFVRAETPPVSLGEAVTMSGQFATVEMDDDKARGVSGIACMAPQESRRLCLAVNDEERFAEWAVLEGMRLAPTGDKVQLLTQAKTQKDAIVGAMPSNNCDKIDDFEEFDGEAIAAAAGKVYVVGSHACSRKKGKFKPSAFVLARLDANGKAVGAQAVERTWRVADIIANSPLKNNFARPKDIGANIEGMAIVGDGIYFGFRTPVIDGKATILHTQIEPLFVQGADRATAIPGVIEMALGDGVGIRDLATLPDGRLLVLSGPAMNGDAPYLLHLLTPATGAWRTLVELRTDKQGKDSDGKVERAKAEAISVLDADAGNVTVIATYDNIDDGAPRIHRIALPKD